MAEVKKIKTALISVFHKDGLDELLKKLNAEGVKFLSKTKKSHSNLLFYNLRFTIYFVNQP